MYEIIFGVILFILSFTGVCFAFILVFAKASAPDKSRKYTVVCVLDKEDGHALLRLRWIYNALSVLGLRDYFRIAVLTQASDVKTADRLKNDFPDRELLFICTKADFFEKICK